VILASRSKTRNRQWQSRDRFGLVLDLENLTREHRKASDWRGAALALGELLNCYSRMGKVLFCIAVCDRRLARDLGPKLERYGVKTIRHDGGTNEADRRLIGFLRILSDRCTTIIIGSGDGVFAPEARRLSGGGKRVIAVARPGAISAELYASVDDFQEFPLKP
jgi:uncharacterized LabA/DUF88 family protein